MRSSAARRRDSADLVAADAALVGTLDALDGAVNYRDWILALATPFLEGAEQVLELGAGHGTFTEELARSARVTAVEVGPEALSRLATRFAGSTRVTVSGASIEHLDPNSSDAAFLSNVLEHIEDDAGALVELARIVRPSGHVVVFSPAFPLLYSRFDARIGHHHRYRLAGLRRKFDAAGLDVVEARYVNSVGFFAWLLLVRLFRLTPGDGGLAQRFDRWVVPVLRRLEGRWRPPFGQSVLVVGRVRG